MPSLQRATLSDPVLPFQDRVSAPPWVIAAIGVALILVGLAYFVARFRRGGLDSGR